MARKPTQTPDHPAYTAMLAAAASLGWPERFGRDLTVHDRQDARRHPGAQPFAWVVGPSGTYLVWATLPEPRHHRTGTDVLCASAGEAVNGLDGACRWFWWDGSALVPSTLAEVTDRLLDFEEQARRIGVDPATGALRAESSPGCSRPCGKCPQPGSRPCLASE